MCGIFGIVHSGGGLADPERLRAMSGLLVHRGPDGHGFHCEGRVGLGMNRLAILDPVQGAQPMYSPDGRFCIVYNGEVYNHRDLRPELLARGHEFHTGCDTETVLAAFIEYGPACLDRFNGMFAFAVWDKAEERLFLCRDRLGVKPLYLARGEDCIAFASEPKALLGVTGRPRVDWTGVARYFLLGYVPSPDSAFAGIEKLPAGHYACLDRDGLRSRQYYAPEYGLGGDPGNGDLAGQLDRLLAEAVEREMLSDVPVGLFLSGGLDSSAVAAYAVRVDPDAMRSFALRFEESTHDESADAALVARHLGLDHREYSFDRGMLLDAFDEVARVLDEPFGDSTVLPLYLLSRFARESVKVVLTGWGGDEIFAGYPTYRAHRLARLYRALPPFLSRGLIPAMVNRLPVSDRYMSFEFKAKRFIRGAEADPMRQHLAWMGYFDRSEFGRLFSESVRREMRGDFEAAFDEFIASMPEEDVVDRAMRMDARYFLEGNGLFQADRMTMAASLEARVPLLNPDLVAWVNGLGADRKMPRGRLKGLLKQALAHRLPEAILRKPKKGFGPPTSHWMRTVFGPVFEHYFSEESVRRAGVFQYEAVRELLDAHRMRRADNGRKLWALLSFQAWYEQFIATGS